MTQEYYKTLHHDATLEKKENGLWDYTWKDNNYKDASGLESVHNACILALLTGYNEIGRHQIPPYQNFGNRSYELLKKNKDNLTQHKIESYFTECLENIRRIREVQELIVTENIKGSLYTYNVFFRVLTITNEVIEDNISLNNNYTIPTSIKSIDKLIRTPTDNSFSFTLLDKYNNPVPHQVVRVLVDDEIIDREITGTDGVVSFTIPLPPDKFHFYLRVESEPTTKYKESDTVTDNIIAIFKLDINHDGELIYEYYTDYVHPDFMLNSAGELLMQYNDEIISFESISINEDGYLIMNT